MDEAGHLFQFFFFDPHQWVEVFHFARELAVETGGVELRDAGDAALAGDEVFPAFLSADAERADKSYTRDHNAASQLCLAP